MRRRSDAVGRLPPAAAAGCRERERVREKGEGEIERGHG
jgi:hypothetical protein